MGVRFTGTFKPWLDHSNDIQVDIGDVNGGGDLPIRIVSVETITEGDARDPMTVINPQRVEVTFLIEDDIYAQIIDDLATSIDDRFYVQLIENGYIFFAGAVEHNFIRWPDLPYPYPFTIAATDGLSRAKDIDYLDEDQLNYVVAAEDRWELATTHLFNCLAKLNLDQVYAGGFDTKRVWINCNWYATNMDNFTDSPLDQLWINYDLFYTIDNDGNYLSNSCYEVLEAILQALGMRVEYGLGIYRFEQLSEKTAGLNSYFTYDLQGNFQSVRNQKWDWPIEKDFTNPRDANKPKATGEFEMLPPLRQVKVLYKYPVEGTAEEVDEDYGFGLSGLGKVCYVWPNSGLLKEVTHSFGDELPDPLRFRVHFQLMVKTTNDVLVDPTEWVNHRYHIRIFLGVESRQSSGDLKIYTYKFNLEKYNAVGTLPPNWVAYAGPGFDGYSTIAGTDGYDFMIEPYAYPGSRSKYYDLGFETKAYPEAAQDFVTTFVCVQLVDIVTEDQSTITGGDYTFEWAISDLKVIIAADNEKAKPTEKEQEFLSTIELGGKEERTINIRLSDRGESIRVGTNKLSAGGWGVGAGGSKELGQLLADEYHKVRGKPIRIMSRTIIGTQIRSCNNLTLFEYCGKHWQSLFTSHALYPFEITGSWWAIDQDVTPTTVSKKFEVGINYNRLDEKGSDPFLPPPNLESLGTDGNGFTANASEYIITEWDLPDKTQYSEKQIRERLDVYINGVKSYYIEGTPVGPQQFTINNVNNSISLDGNHPLSKRHVIWVLLKY